jgi:coenzyme F420-reducing hydrogenase gamma subunit
MGARRPKLAVWKFASCDGCQLTLLDCEDRLLELADRYAISHFREATTAGTGGPYDLSLVEGSITTAADQARIRDVRARSRTLVTIGACATMGGIQALRNGADLGGWLARVYPRPEWIATLATSTPIADHVAVDFALGGCPVDRSQLLDVLEAFLQRRRPRIARISQCMECKAAGTICVMVAHGTPCLGPLTQAGCGNLCPPLGRGCYGCFGRKEGANPAALAAWFGPHPGSVPPPGDPFQALAERPGRTAEPGR